MAAPFFACGAQGRGLALPLAFQARDPCALGQGAFLGRQAAALRGPLKAAPRQPLRQAPRAVAVPSGGGNGGAKTAQTSWLQARAAQLQQLAKPLSDPEANSRLLALCTGGWVGGVGGGPAGWLAAALGGFLLSRPKEASPL